MMPAAITRNVTVVGAGAWGSALARLLATGPYPAKVVLWGHDGMHLDEMRTTSRNERYLSGVLFPEGIRYERDLTQACTGAEVILLAVPSKAFRTVVSQIPKSNARFVTVTKGIESSSGLTMSAVASGLHPGSSVAALSGPSLALEVCREVPTAVVAASQDEVFTREVQALFHRTAFRVYTSSDIVGVELGGALKNVIAIAAGVCDGMGFGDNSKAALITRAIVEIRRLGMACGANGETFAGLSGLGDLTVTCFSRLSRNRSFGERLGKGEKPEQILAFSVSVAEGYPTALSAYQLAKRLDVYAPILNEVHAMLYEGKDVRAAVRDLITRDSKKE